MKKMITTFVLTSAVSLLVSPAFAQDITIVRPSIVPDTSLGQVVGAAVGFLLILAAILAFIYLIIGGLQWITSGGDKSGMEAARNRITAAIVGLIIVAAAWAIMILVGQFIGFNFIQDGFDVPSITDK